ncbi:hypothetical protein JCM8547_008076 [Rhodosporidiobolus lusitaniae]
MFPPPATPSLPRSRRSSRPPRPRRSPSSPPPLAISPDLPFLTTEPLGVYPDPHKPRFIDPFASADGTKSSTATPGVREVERVEPQMRWRERSAFSWEEAPEPRSPPRPPTPGLVSPPSSSSAAATPPLPSFPTLTRAYTSALPLPPAPPRSSRRPSTARQALRLPSFPSSLSSFNERGGGEASPATPALSFGSSSSSTSALGYVPRTPCTPYFPPTSTFTSGNQPKAGGKEEEGEEGEEGEEDPWRDSLLFADAPDDYSLPSLPYLSSSFPFPLPPLRPRPHLKLVFPSSSSSSPSAPSPNPSSLLPHDAGSDSPTVSLEQGATIGLGLRIQLDDLPLSTFRPSSSCVYNDKAGYGFFGGEDADRPEGKEMLAFSSSSSSEAVWDEQPALDLDFEEGPAGRSSTLTIDSHLAAVTTALASSTAPSSSLGGGHGEDYPDADADPFDLRRFLRSSEISVYPSSLGEAPGEDVKEEGDEEGMKGGLWRRDERFEGGFDSEEEEAGKVEDGVVGWSAREVREIWRQLNDATHLDLAGSTSSPARFEHLLEDSCNAHRSLVVLDLSSCGITNVPPAFAALTGLQELNISQNPLSSSSLDVLSSLSSLRILHLDSCSLSFLPSSFSTLKQLHTLCLRSNLLRTLPSWLSRLSSSLQVLLVDGNPFHPRIEHLVQPIYVAFFLSSSSTTAAAGEELPTGYHAALRSLLAYLRDLDDLSPSSSSTSPLPPSHFSPPSSPEEGEEASRSAIPTLRALHSLNCLPSSSSAASFPRGRSNSSTTLPSSPSLPSLRRIQSTRNLRSLASFSSSPTLPSPSFPPLPSAPLFLNSPPSPSLPPSSPTQAYQRLATLLEIVSSETTYLRGLTELCVIYLAPFHSGEQILPARERKAVFANVDGIREFHQSVLLPELIGAAAVEPGGMGEGEEEVSEKRTREAAGRVAEVFVRHAAFLRIYSTYINSFDLALSRIAAWAKSPSSSSSTPRPATTGSIISSPKPATLSSSPLSLLLPNFPASSRLDGTVLTPAQKKRIKSWLKRCRLHPSHSQISLESYLLLPVQRIPRYRLLLESLLACTPPSPLSPSSLFDPASTALEQAVEILRGLAEELNESKRREEGRVELVEWQRRIVLVDGEGEGEKRRVRGVRLVQPHRGLVKVGEVVLSRSVKRTRIKLDEGDDEDIFTLTHETKKQHLIALLCTDVLLLLIPPSPPSRPSFSSPSSPSSSSYPRSGYSTPVQPKPFELWRAIKFADLVASSADEGPATLFGEDGMLRLVTPTSILYLRFPFSSHTSPSSPSFSPSSPSSLTSPSSTAFSFSSLPSPPLTAAEFLFSSTSSSSSSSPSPPPSDSSPAEEAGRHAREWRDAVNARWREERGEE